MGIDDFAEVFDFDVRPLTHEVYTALMTDVWPTPRGCLNFGLVSERHYGSLQFALRHGVTPGQLDEALGNGKLLTAMIGPDNPYPGVTFRTVWDEEELDADLSFGELSLYPGWGKCPDCSRNDGYLNVGRYHWFVCHAHRHKWLGGSNLFPIGKYETEVDWDANRRILDGYSEIQPAGFGTDDDEPF